jgi:flagellar protein FliO/FliZ
MEPTMPGPTVWMIALGALGAAIMALVVVLRGRSRRAAHAATRGQRISVIETREIDDERRLVIVRCDGAEHLLLIGGGADILVKSDLTRSEPRVGFPPAESGPLPTRTAERRTADTAVGLGERSGMPPPPLTGRPEPEGVQEPPKTVQAFAPARTATAAQPVAADATADPASGIPRGEPSGSMVTEPDFTEMTRKLEEALKRSAAIRPPSQQEPRIEPIVAPPGAAPGQPVGSSDPFEDEIRRLLGREPGRR